MDSNQELFFYQRSSDLPDGMCKRDQFKKQHPRMLDFINAINPIELKYEIQETLPASARARAAEFEERFQYSSITKREYSYILDNLRLVYGNEGNIVTDDIEAFHKVETRLICSYFGIPQLNQMFDEDYFNFEWDMHVGQNFREHRNDYYRDHFIHQIRNLYMMLTLLDKLNFYAASENILRNSSASKVSEFTCKKSLVFRTDQMGAQQQCLNRIYEDYKEQYREQYQIKYKAGHSKDNDEELNNAIKNDALIFEDSPFVSLPDFIDAYFYKYVIYASSMLSALFHDMGYPICHFLDVRRRISEYNPTMYMFTHNAVESFDQLAFKLGSSLLFSVASPEVVRKRLEPQKKGNYDHGAYSAIAFLLQFYDTGVIYSLSAEKQCAIELAALAIFNHTSRFKIIDSKADTSHYNMYFRQNPISFLLRFCDDLQEWDRRYFEISKSSDLLFCPDCGLPLLKHKDHDEFGHPLSSSTYSCKCQKNLCRPALIRPDIFIKRKLYLVSVADWVKMELRNDKERNDERNLIVTINYDPYKLLMLAKTNNTYAKHRLKELREVKMILSDQDFSFMSDGVLPFSHIYLEYFMTANPVLIKLKILERYYLYYLKKTGHQDVRKIGKENIKHLIQADRELPENELSKYLFGSEEPETKGVLAFYCFLLQDCYSKKAQLSDEVKSYLLPYQNADPMYFKIISWLIQDCLDQYKNDPRRAEPYIDETKEDAFYQIVASYTDDHNYFNDYETIPISVDSNSPKYPYIGYFKDIYLFYRMNELTKRTLREQADESKADQKGTVSDT